MNIQQIKYIKNVYIISIHSNRLCEKSNNMKKQRKIYITHESVVPVYHYVCII